MRYTRPLALLVLAGSLLAILPACTSPSLPEADPDITGTISGLTAGSGGASTGSFLVTGEGEFDMASVSVTEETEILLDSGGSTLQEVGFSEFQDGDTVRVWTTGVVRESYPVQVDAATILIEGEAR